MKPSIPKGTRDFSAMEIAKRNYIFTSIKNNFEKFGFAPIETPSFENSETLMGKYGEEGDRLIFKILNSGDYLRKVTPELLEEKNSTKITSKISEKALRYDLTVPFARYVVQHRNDLVFPFKRYQMQAVWRADRPQKGRFREFYQCDADVVGSKSLWQEVSFVQLYDSVFYELGLKDVSIKINNRKILAGIAEVIGEEDKLIDFTIALDKLDKIGKEGVIAELLKKEITPEAIKKLEPLFNFKGDSLTKLAQLEKLLQNSDIGKKGIEELYFVIDKVTKLGLKTAILEVDITLARGLNYYTGVILEVTANQVAIGSIGGGGRYDDLTSIFGLKDLSGMGISFGLDRIYLVLEELELFTKVVIPKPQVLFINFGENEAFYAMQTIKELRDLEVRAELYPDNAKMKKQMGYADKRTIPFVVLAGENEMKNKQFTLKNMISGEQKLVNFKELMENLR
ncbi:MAG TPA: histidine--tRNA ligase [Lutibacter sp.]|nr:histidine--tRNA ligase [Lutibacter sp.]